MADDKTALDVLGESHIPSDLLVPTLGSKYGLDGYEDMQYNAGVLEGVLDPDLLPGPALPDGITGVTIRGAAEMMDVGDVLKEEPLADLHWLADATQDPERLPVSPVDQSIPELEEAWGTDRRTDGIKVYSSDLNRSRYEASLTDDTPSSGKASVRDLLRVVSHAMRRSAAGHSVEAIVEEAVTHMGYEAPRIAKAVEMLRDEHGLAGKVFIRASAYPNYGAGKWRDHLRKHASGAKYVLVSEDDLRGATWIQNGRCAITGKKAVSEIPWGEAFSHYAPRLEAMGRKASSEDDPKSALRTAFLSHPGDSNKRTASAQMGLTFMGSEMGSGSVYLPEQTISEGSLPTSFSPVTDDAQHFLSGEEKMVAAGSREHDGNYQGSVFREAPVSNASVKLPDHEARMAKAATEGGVSVPEIRGMLRWASQQMSEGFAGKDLNDLIQYRFTDKILRASSGLLSDLRETHEGLAGFLYVDAAAYVSPTGISGCEEGGRKHRANQLRAVSSVGRCVGCTSSRMMEDGTRKCAVYSKVLLDRGDLPPEIAQVKNANIESADMSDEEVTASLFASSYDPAEFGLHNANLESVAVEPAPNLERLGEIVLGGLRWE